MRTERLFIFDLDDTLFETRAINFSIFEEVNRIILDHFSQSKNEQEIHQILEDFKDFPIDHVARKYEFSDSLIHRLYQFFQTNTFKLDITVFADYPFIKMLDGMKVIVTTGITPLQNAKIDALGIRSDFSEIHIDDPLDRHRKFKKGLFSEIMKDWNVQSNDVWIIGDNPESELRAGYELGCNTIQRIKKNTSASDLVNHSLQDFEELPHIIAGYL